ncbi:alginate lyase [Agrobacterium tumefaciens]|uniref:alginate lyase family protein n=1 Tax=Agrobacterium tumefaciens TaxID=358 RepID=UPI0012B98D33|nr:alginate lyase family protein [Agrobacterium tumefaciens]MQB04921.1 alginate lyase [Agrobacterium tumefaciens]
MAIFSGIPGAKTPLRHGIVVALGVWFCVTSAATAAPAYDGLFDVAARKAAIAADTSGRLRKQCLAIKADSKWLDLEVVDGFRPTAGYGSDRAGAQFAWAVMVLSGRSLGGDAASTKMLRTLLNTWADRGAFEKTEVGHDAYYALKRALLPAITAFSIIRDDLPDGERSKIQTWLDPLVRRVDQTFNGDVDVNNHRYLADSVLMTWGGIVGDDGLYEKGRSRFLSILDEARANGGLPLETRRGARALWYMRQSLTSMVVMAEVARGHGENLYVKTSGDANPVKRSIWTVFGYWLNGINDPVLVNAYAAENYIPGPSRDYLQQDTGFLDNRGNGRHYLAFLEALAAVPAENISMQRAIALLQKDAATERPLIDEFVGGNATCFWGK